MPGPSQSHFGDGSTVTFNITFAILGSFSGLRVNQLLQGEVDEELLTEDTHYSVSRTNGVPTSITFFTAPAGDGTAANSTTIRIERFTDRDRGVDYVSGSAISEANLDNDANRLKSVDDEIEGNISDAMRLTIDGTRWNARGITVGNGEEAVEPDDLPTLAQVTSLIAQQDLLEINDAQVFCFTGDGYATQFELEGVNNVSTRGLAFVIVNNVVQSACALDSPYTLLNPDDSAFPSAGTVWTWIDFDEAPADGATIEVRILGGLVRATVDGLSIDTEHIVDDAVTIDKIDFVAGSAKRFIVVDVNGDPALQQLTPADMVGTYVAASATAGFNSAVRESRLDQMAAPTASVSMNSRNITNLLAGTVSTHAVNKAQMDAADAVALQSAKDYTDAEIANLETEVEIEEQALDGDLDILHDRTVTFASAPNYIQLMGEISWDSGGFAARNWADVTIPAPTSGTRTMVIATAHDNSINFTRHFRIVVTFVSATSFTFSTTPTYSLESGVALGIRR